MASAVPIEALAALRRRLAALSARHPERRRLMESTAQLYAISRATLYRLLRDDRRPKEAYRSDRDRPRVLPADEIERLCAIVAAMKIRTTNKKGRHLSTVRVLELLEKHGVDTPDGFFKLDKGRLTASTLNRHLSRLGYDHQRMTREPPAVRFQAEHSNALWHFDLSPSDLKQLKAPPWIDPERQGAPSLMLFSVVDDRSGVAYQEYRCVYGEDVEAALRFLFNAMAPKADAGDLLQGIPSALHLDNGPVAKSAVFKRVMESLGVAVITHMPAGSDGRRTTARAKGKSLPRRRPGSSGRFAPSRKPTRRSTTFMNRRARKRRTAGWRGSSPPTTPRITAPSRIRGATTGWRICLPTGSARCAPGSGSAPLRANPNGAWSASTAA
jgi:hypothetical protein